MHGIVETVGNAPVTPDGCRAHRGTGDVTTSEARGCATHGWSTSTVRANPVSSPEDPLPTVAGRSGAAATAAATTPAATAAAGGCRGRTGAPAGHRDRGQQAHRVVVALRAGGRCRGVPHRSGNLERVAARAAAEVISRHAPTLRPRADPDRPSSGGRRHPVVPPRKWLDDLLRTWPRGRRRPAQGGSLAAWRMVRTHPRVGASRSPRPSARPGLPGASRHRQVCGRTRRRLLSRRA
jgi:hypothetical protein